MISSKPRIIVKRPPLKLYQIAAFFHEKRYAWIEGTTKCGKTFTGIVWLFEQAVIGKFKNYWWVAPTYKTAKIAYTRMADAIPKGLRHCNETDLTITLPNGHIIWFLSGEKPDNLYGEDVGAVVIDEDTRMRESAWWAIRTVVTKTQGKVRGIGNIKGRKNWAYQMCRKAQAEMESKGKDATSHWASITSLDAIREGIITQEEVDDAKANLPKAVFDELYMGIPTEDGSNPFGMQYIAAAVAPQSTKPSVCYGMDLARAVDWTVNVGLDFECTVSDFDRFQKPWEDAYPAIHSTTDKSKSICLVDSTGIGDPILARLQKDRPGRYEGYKFSRQSKQKLMEGLAVAIQTGMVRFPDGIIRRELENFEFEYTGSDGHSTGVRYSAPEGFSDDCVMALALAVAQFKKHESRQERAVYPQFGEENLM